MKPERCFHETDPAVSLMRRAAVESIGSALLVLLASCAGTATQRAFPNLPGLTLPLVAVVIAAGLASLIIAIGKISGGHFNPLISASQWVMGERSTNCAAIYMIAQCGGGLVGGIGAALLWGGTPGSGASGSWTGFPSEVIASAGLLLIVFGCARSGRPETGPFAVGAWLIAAIIATPSASYANPAVVLGAVVSSGPFALRGAALMPFLSAELVGTLLALICIRLIFPAERSTA